MSYLLPSMRFISAALGFVLVTAVPISAQQASAREVRTAEEQFKNIQVLKGFPADQIVPTMHVVESSLGVNCEYCHIQQDRSKDDLEAKRTARRMMAMVFEINKNTFNGEQVVTCYTCHRGSPAPLSTIILPIPNPMIEQPKQAAPSLPPADQVFHKYIQALGGEQAIRRVTSRVITATRDIPTGPGGEIPSPAQVEIYQKAPNLLLSISRTDKLTLLEGFDGSVAWAQSAFQPGVVTDLPNPDQQRARRSANLYESLDLKNQYSRIEVRGIEKVNGHDTYLLVGFPPADTPEQLFFDTQTGLLLARKSVIPTLFGNNPVEIYFDDYRDTGGGVKIPFLAYMIPGSPRSEMWTKSTMKIQKVQDNVSIDNGKFNKPASKPAGALQ